MRVPTTSSDGEPSSSYGALVGSAPPLGAGGFSPGSAAGGSSYLLGTSLPKKSTFSTRSPASSKPSAAAGFASPSPGKSSYRGVRQRPWGKVRPPPLFLSHLLIDPRNARTPPVRGRDPGPAAGRARLAGHLRQRRRGGPGLRLGRAFHSRRRRSHKLPARPSGPLHPARLPARNRGARPFLARALLRLLLWPTGVHSRGG